ncbi:MAG TPA: fibrillarin-like rRNA/tRNA 2'-O-methyltransferase [Methanothermobacter sp.]|nr:fibrillarin-like rRNA/tRNA 2'-O-methyltransferase [Methanothermobacter sp. MT-2]HHW04643.1 fibrillarin-like rRNA/tRNA 2'-O-methyltransferase [Methanothermobacter sp.]HOK72108.1 fibrillarin-like rRNA/tRNA 2'-O-methyltransferase [Methanothermobacter sp.]HOL68421.1 fibrillarin-like rRNA/tRNA 2'-O-methyltransferase [Methanothermobacter sp.]HPQ04179.1 fibrillarin-like rRNA/tRNA 2'-O-methyltransferase [Methanothermobacter sp.]
MKKIKGIEGIYLHKDHLVTVNLTPTLKVYGEKLFKFGGREYRIWDPHRSKMAAAILNGLRNLKIKKNSKMLYLGASSGTTASHFSDMIPDGIIYCLEFSPRMMRELVKVCENRKNMIPLLKDATRPRDYLHLIEKVDFIYCDVAQPRQSQLFTENMKLFLRREGQGLLMVKSRSIDVTRKPSVIFKEEEEKIKSSGFKVLERVRLEPYEKDHMALVVEFW